MSDITNGAQGELVTLMNFQSQSEDSGSKSGKLDNKS